ncbi:MAG: hypothetical protein QNJ97_08325 [Myxococcota bacterium]|nr:hypothetical protein [Myxococcota bacterium]
MADRTDAGFICGCCGRDRPLSLLSNAGLRHTSGQIDPVCAQCENFLTTGLPCLVEKIAAQKKEFLKKNPSPGVQRPAAKPATRRGITSIPSPIATQRPGKAKAKKKQRLASATECEVFFNRSLVLTRYVEGFIKGLEAAGLERSALSQEALAAVNFLLRICQELATERLRVNSGTLARSEVRRLSRHIGETTLMVDEYIAAITESCAKTGT